MKTYDRPLPMYYSMVAYQTFVSIGMLMRNLCPDTHIVTGIVKEFELEREYWLAWKHLLDGLQSDINWNYTFRHRVLIKILFLYFHPVDARCEPVFIINKFLPFRKAVSSTFHATYDFHCVNKTRKKNVENLQTKSHNKETISKLNHENEENEENWGEYRPNLMGQQRINKVKQNENKNLFT